MAVITVYDKTPDVGSAAFVAPNATLAGDVVLAAGSSVWYGAVVRGDTGAIRIGKNSNIQDNAVLHTGPNLGVTIGKNVSIGHSAVVHGCTVGDGALIGMHATVMNGAVVGKNAVVAAGALVLENTVVPDGMVAMGVPAKVREAASPALVEANRKNAEGYVAEATAHAEASHPPGQCPAHGRCSVRQSPCWPRWYRSTWVPPRRSWPAAIWAQSAPQTAPRRPPNRRTP